MVFLYIWNQQYYEKIVVVVSVAAKSFCFCVGGANKITFKNMVTFCFLPKYLFSCFPHTCHSNIYLVQNRDLFFCAEVILRKLIFTFEKQISENIWLKMLNNNKNWGGSVLWKERLKSIRGREKVAVGWQIPHCTLTTQK